MTNSTWTADEWNASYPVGTPVAYHPTLGCRSDEIEHTRTRSEAWTLGHGTAVVKVEGRSGGVSLEHIRVATASASTTEPARVFTVTREQCEATITGVCPGCGGPVTALETVDNSGAPTHWSGCERCSVFTEGCPPEIHRLARTLVEEGTLVPYPRHQDDTGWLESNTREAARIVRRIDRLRAASGRLAPASTPDPRGMLAQLIADVVACRACGKEHQYRDVTPPGSLAQQFSWADPDDGHAYYAAAPDVVADWVRAWVQANVPALGLDAAPGSYESQAMLAADIDRLTAELDGFHASQPAVEAAFAERGQLRDDLATLKAAAGLADHPDVSFVADAIRGMLDSSRLLRTQIRPQLARAEADRDETRRLDEARRRHLAAMTAKLIALRKEVARIAGMCDAAGRTEPKYQAWEIGGWLRAALDATPVAPPSDDELPGMWETADLTGGETDAAADRPALMERAVTALGADRDRAAAEAHRLRTGIEAAIGMLDDPAADANRAIGRARFTLRALLDGARPQTDPPAPSGHGNCCTEAERAADEQATYFAAEAQRLRAGIEAGAERLRGHATRPVHIDIVNYLLALLDGTTTAPTEPTPVPYAEHERAVLEVIAERDRYHETADQLADAISAMTAVDIGEHSSTNDPWRNALDAAKHAPTAAEPQGAVDIEERLWRKPASEETCGGLLGMLADATARFDRIAGAHAKDVDEHGGTSGDCIECGHVWPCPTYVWAATDRAPLNAWDPRDDTPPAVAEPAPDTPPMGAPIGAQHVGRAWTGTEIEDGCPCPKEPCGLVDPLRAVPECEHHPTARAKSIRQGHRASDCPGTPPTTEPPKPGAPDLMEALIASLPDRRRTDTPTTETGAGRVSIADLLPAKARDLPWTWEDEERNIRTRQCLCCGRPGHYQEMVEAHIAANGVEGLGILVKDGGYVGDGHHRVVAALKLGIDELPVETKADAQARWVKDHGHVDWANRKFGDR